MTMAARFVTQPQTQTTPAPVLVVEDDQSIRALLAEVLEDEGYAVVTAPNGAVALELIDRLGPDQPSAIVLDMWMPVMEGQAFAESYRRSHARPAPIIALAGMQGDRERAQQAAAACILDKPFDLADFLGAVYALSN